MPFWLPGATADREADLDCSGPQPAHEGSVPPHGPYVSGRGQADDSSGIISSAGVLSVLSFYQPSETGEQVLWRHSETCGSSGCRPVVSWLSFLHRTCLASCEGPAVLSLHASGSLETAATQPPGKLLPCDGCPARDEGWFSEASAGKTSLWMSFTPTAAPVLFPAVDGGFHVLIPGLFYSLLHCSRLQKYLWVWELWVAWNKWNTFCSIHWVPSSSLGILGGKKWILLSGCSDLSLQMTKY